jgi:3-oxoacyl-[acyl-carrier protein] reductase
MLLKNKVAVIYGGSGAVGSAVAHAFAEEGARVFLGGRSLEKLEHVANEIRIAGGQAEALTVNALDNTSIASFLKEIISRTGRVDISFNAISLDDIQGFPLTALSYDQFSLPIINAIESHFLTATAAARQMASQGAGTTKQEFQKAFEESTMLKRLPKLKEVANAAVFLACDKSSAITAAVLNVTCGELAD